MFHEAMILDGCNRYPNDSEKLMLASQTGLTKNQVIPLPHFLSFVSCPLFDVNVLTFMADSGFKLVHKCSGSAVETYD